MRGKQFLYDEGTHIPLIVRGPNVPRGAVRADLVEHIDMAASSLAAADIKIPSWMQGRNFFASDGVPREAVFAARDRCDETVDRIRSVRTDQWLFIRNEHPARPMLQPNAYKDGKSILQRLRSLHASGSLSPLQEKILSRRKDQKRNSTTSRPIHFSLRTSRVIRRMPKSSKK